MGFKAIKHQIIGCLNNGNISHDERKDIDIKNLLATGDMVPQEIIEILKKSRGNEHQSSPHHYDLSITVHVVKTSEWYIKWYFSDPNSIFISVHK